MSKHDALRAQMAPEEFSQLLAALHALAPKRCLEWGSGGSTRAVLEQCGSVERFVSVEHDPEWHHRVEAGVRDQRLELHLVPPDQPAPPRRWLRRDREAWDARAEQDQRVMAAYVALPATLATAFDFVLVDGRARRFCLAAGWDLLRPGGVLVLHDAQRPEYHDAFFSLGRPLLLSPWRRGQLGLLRKPILNPAPA